MVLSENVFHLEARECQVKSLMKTIIPSFTGRTASVGFEAPSQQVSRVMRPSLT